MSSKLDDAICSLENPRTTRMWCQGRNDSIALPKSNSSSHAHPVSHSSVLSSVTAQRSPGALSRRSRWRSPVRWAGTRSSRNLFLAARSAQFFGVRSSARKGRRVAGRVSIEGSQTGRIWFTACSNRLDTTRHSYARQVLSTAGNKQGTLRRIP